MCMRIFEILNQLFDAEGQVTRDSIMDDGYQLILKTHINACLFPLPKVSDRIAPSFEMSSITDY